jgi:hypothetical protein
MDLSYEYDYKVNKLSTDIRFSYFFSNINFINKLYEIGLIKNTSIYREKYYLYKDILKDDLVTYSFIIKNNKIFKLKLYFDIDVSKNINIKNKFIEKLKNKLTEKIVLVAFTFK